MQLLSMQFMIFFNNLYLKIQKVAFSGFLLGNREKIAVVANDEFSLFPAKMPP